MNLKRIFGALLTMLGIAGLIYTAVLFVNTAGGTHNIKTIVIYGILSIVFFTAGISLVRTTKDESWTVNHVTLTSNNIITVDLINWLLHNTS